MNSLITPYRPEHFSTISNYFPPEWNFDFGVFMARYINQSFFRGFTLQLRDNPEGFGNLFVFGTVCWIGNIVVSEKHRKKGYGTQITRYLIQKGRDLGAGTFNLVATELGEPIYRKMGFKTECMYEFYKLKGKLPELEISEKIRQANSSDIIEIIDLDFRIAREERGEMIQSLRDSIHVIQDPNDKPCGYYIEGLGDGFIAAEDPETGIELLKMKIASYDRQVVIPGSNHRAKTFLSDHGFEKIMQLPRMTLGEKCNWKPEHIFSRGTGYCG